MPTARPIVGSRMATTIDHIPNVWFGMDLVMGWFPFFVWPATDIGIHRAARRSRRPFLAFGA